VLESLAVILLCRLYRKKADPVSQRIYREYTLSPEMLRRSREARKSRGRRRQQNGPAGRVYNLELLFSDINAEHFANSLSKPVLSWTLRPSRSVLGSYEFDDDIIYVSSVLDSARVPLYVVRYILYHEMLHVKYGTRVQGGREIVHPPEFLCEERQFPDYRAANRWLDAH